MVMLPITKSKKKSIWYKVAFRRGRQIISLMCRFVPSLSPCPSNLIIVLMEKGRLTDRMDRHHVHNVTLGMGMVTDTAHVDGPLI